ncbi:MAG: SUMF1/EgtB/PvdO family nonheme iron enzyme [Hyphomonadaceae bacterium]
MRKFFRAPPDAADDFFALFHLIWDQGIGNKALAEGLCGEKWTVDSLITAFEQVGGAISDRSIEEWRRGKFVPGPQNLRLLLAVISDTSTRDAWRDVLMSAARRTRERRKLEEQRADEAQEREGAGGSGHLASYVPDDPEPSTEGSLSTDAAARPLPQWRRWLWALIAGIGSVVIAAGATWALQPRVSELRICDVANFSVASQKCSRHMDQFPDGTLRVYVSFSVLNHPDNKPFTRTWFLNGRNVLEREGLLAPPWDGWTWYGAADPDRPDPTPIDNGNYTFRVSAGSAVATTSFVVGVDRKRPIGQRFRDLAVEGEGVGPDMIVLPRGNFAKGSSANENGRMNDEGPQVDVTINYNLAVSVHEITWNDWMKCVDDGGCNGHVPADRSKASGDQPVVNVSYNDVFAYTHWLNRRLGIPQERFDRYTLLSESEWEYAALAGARAEQGQGSNKRPSINPADGSYRDGDRSPAGPVEVGLFRPNAWGLFDMHGNVAELVEDCYRSSHDPSINDGAAYLEAACPLRVMKGGSYRDEADKLRVAARSPTLMEERHPHVGFRLARRLEPR